MSRHGAVERWDRVFGIKEQSRSGKPSPALAGSGRRAEGIATWWRGPELHGRSPGYEPGEILLLHPALVPLGNPRVGVVYRPRPLDANIPTYVPKSQLLLTHCCPAALHGYAAHGIVEVRPLVLRYNAHRPCIAKTKCVSRRSSLSQANLTTPL